MFRGKPRKIAKIYALIYAFDSKYDMAKICREVIDSTTSELPTGNYITRTVSADGKRQLFIGRSGQGQLRYEYQTHGSRLGMPLLETKTVEGACVHGLEVLGWRVPEHVELDFRAGAFSMSKLFVAGPVAAKAQVWSRTEEEDWAAASDVFEAVLTTYEGN